MNQRSDLPSDIGSVKGSGKNELHKSDFGGSTITKSPPGKELNYHFLDGLRGFGAFAVYLHHFMNNYCHLQTIEDRDDGVDQVAPPEWFRNSPVRVVYQGALWVKVFFILSGFVLPLRFFKTGRDTCLTGGSIRRYFRLMIPVLIVMSIYYFFMRMDCFGESTYNKIKQRVYLDVLYDGLLGTWYGNTRWFFPAWTLSVELYASYIIYRLAEVTRDYRGRFYFYFLLVVFILIVEAFGFLQLGTQGLSSTQLNLPFFIIGVAFADLETSEYKPFDKLRALSLWWKIPLNTVLLVLFFFYGSNTNEHEVNCYTAYDEQCPFFKAITFDNFIQPMACQYIGAVSIMVLCLISDVAQWILNSLPMQFLGQVSYTLYLIHELFIVWLQRDTYNVLLDNGVGPEVGLVYIFFIYTPLLLFVSWVLEITVDSPAKKFSNELDIQLRKKRPPPPKTFTDDSEEIIDQADHYSCWSFSKRIWPIFAMIGWLLFVLVTTETFIRFHENRPVKIPRKEYEERA